MHNQEIQNAFQILLYDKVVKTRAGLADALGFSRPLVTRILNGTEKASPEFTRKFEAKYLKPRGQSLKHHRELKIIKPRSSEYATAEEFIVARLAYQEFVIDELLEMMARLLALQPGQNDSATIMKMAREKIQSKVSKVQAV
jgi:hypothetical protein